jgi:hypothetical protein
VDAQADGVALLKRALTILALASCSSDSVTVAPVIDGPAASDPDASPFPLDTLVLEVAHAGDTNDLVSETFSSGQTVQLSDVPFGDDLVIHMTGSVGQSEVAYGRTCEIAVSAVSQPQDPHLFFSRSVKFADLALTPEPRTGGVAIADQHGAGLIVGGVDPTLDTPVTDVERFDPQTGELTVIATVEPRTGTIAAMLGATGIALIGGNDTSGAGASFIEIIDPDLPEGNRVDELDDAGTGRSQLTATTLTTGDVIVIGGFDGGSASELVYDVSIDSNGTASSLVLRSTLAHPRYGHTATRLGADEGAPVLVAGGLDGSGVPVGQAELYKPLDDGFSTTFSATMVVPRTQHQAVLLPDNSVLVIGGIDGSGNGVDTLEQFSLDGGFVQVGTLPADAGLIGFTTTTLPDGRVLLTGGTRDTTPGATPLSTAFIASLDPIDGSVDVVATDALSIARTNHAATLLCDGTVLVAGGTSGTQIAERYNPPAAGRR